MEGITEKVKVLLVNGTEAEVLILKYLPFRKKQAIIHKLTDGLKMKSGQKADDLEIDASRGMDIISDLAEAIWADKNVTLDDVEGDSLYKILTERFDTFLGKLGFRAEVSNSEGGKFQQK